MARPTLVRIDLNALQHNLNRVRELAPSSAVLAMTKANAYGHNLSRVAKALAGAEGFGVACLEEAQVIRDQGLKNRIVLLGGLFEDAELDAVSSLDCDVVVHSFFQIDCLERACLSKPMVVWLKIDTGMHRLGFLPHEVQSAYDRLMVCENVKKPLVLMSHFADSDVPDKTVTQNQLDLFEQTTQGLVGKQSLANSAAILAFKQSHRDWVRPGVMLYGVSPFSDKTGAQLGLKPVMTFETQLMNVKTIKKGECVGYGSTWCADEDGLIGIAAVGYGDGYPRHAKSGTPVLVGGELCSLVGRVSMDMIAIDLQNNPHAKIGERVVLWGERLPVETVAQSADTIPYEILSHITSRVAEVF